MRKTLVLLLAGLFLLCGSVEARTVRLVDDDGVEMDGRLWSTYISDNSSIDYAETQVPTTTITPNNHKILGCDVMQLDPAVSSLMWVGLHDSVSIAGESVSNLSMIDEAEVEDQNKSRPNPWYVHARKIQTQLTINQGPNTRVIIYYSE